MYAMLVLRGPQGRLVIPTESPSLNKVFTYLLTYLLTFISMRKASINSRQVSVNLFRLVFGRNVNGNAVKMLL